jgi:hypothetical protein
MLRYAEWKGEWNSYYGNHRWHKVDVAAKKTGFNEDGQAAMKPGNLDAFTSKVAVTRHPNLLF